MKTYYRLMLGQKSAHAEECYLGNFIGVDYGINEDLTDKLPESWRDFNAAFIPVYLKNRPTKTRIAAGLACGTLWTVAKGLQNGDILLCPDGAGRYRVGEIIGGYFVNRPDDCLPHRRPVRWFNTLIDRQDMSDGLKSTTGSVGALCNISKAGFANEVETLIYGTVPPNLIATEAITVDLATFAMEKHLEDFLVKNWAQTELGRAFDIYTEDGEPVGQQYPTDTGPLDILAVSKDKKQLLVVELKKGKASDAVVGQTLRYMGYVQEELAEEGQSVVGAIIALEDDQRIRRALTMTPAISFYRYQISFKLVKG